MDTAALICWEHWMPVPRQILHDAGEQIHIALWPQVHEIHQIASRHYAFEGRCLVIAAGQCMPTSQVPGYLSISHELLNQPDYLLRGGSCIIGPDGQYIMKPQWDLDKVIYSTLELNDVFLQEGLTLDVSGHYGRSDLFSINIKP